VGGGIETHLGGNVTGKIEYLHMSFGTDTNRHQYSEHAADAIAFASTSRRTLSGSASIKFDPNGADAPVYQPASSAAIGAAALLKAPVPGSGPGTVLSRRQCRLQLGPLQHRRFFNTTRS
jgi:hypothetical protein